MAEHHGPARQLLLVDPGGELRERLAGALSAAGLSHRAVETTAACLDAIRAESPAGVVTGHDPPSTDGLALIETVRTIDATVPVFLVSQQGSERLAGRAIAAGVDGYAPLTESPADIVDRLATVIDGSQVPEAREVRDRYRRLVETSPAPINLFDADGRIVYSNDATADLLDVEDRTAMVGRSIFEFVHPDDRPKAESELQQVVEKEAAGPTRMRVVSESGEVKHIQVSTAPGEFRGEDIGQAVVLDLTPFEAMRSELDAERRFVDNAMDALQDIFYVLDTDGRLVRWNEAAVTVTGYEPDELEGSSLDDLIYEDDVSRIQSVVAAVLSGQSDVVVEARLRTKSGRTIPYEFRGRRLEDDDGEVLGKVGIARDISLRQERSQQLRVIDRLLRHNIRNDITKIQGHAELLAADPERPESVETILRTCRSITRTAEKERKIVTALSQRQDPAAFDLPSVVASVADRVRTDHPTATVETDGVDAVTVRTIPAIQEAIFELVDNAVRHAETAAPTVRLRTERSADAVTLSVVDDGPPIPEMEIDVVTGDRQIDDLTHSSGLGLWFVSWVVGRSAAAIEFDRRADGGNEVQIVFATDAERAPPDPEGDGAAASERPDMDQ
ncbi:PAS domain S-box protein [Halobacteriales archaeon Cl-PHB]